MRAEEKDQLAEEARLNMEEGVRLTLEEIHRAYKEKEQHIRLKAEEETRLVQ